MPFIILPRLLVVPVALSLAFLIAVMWIDAGSLIPVYHAIMLGVVLPLVARNQARLSATLATIPLPAFWRLVLLGYLAVMLEETLVGTLHGLQEGASLTGTLVLIGQFIFFNLFAFTGLIIGFALVSRIYWLGRWDLFVIAGLWGAYAEGMIQRLLASPIVAGLLFIPTMAVYALILLPGQLSLNAEERGKRTLHIALRVPLALALMWILSVPAIIAVTALRTAHPDLFPPCEFIACG